MGSTSDACWFLLIKNKKREAALKNEAGGEEKRAFFYLFIWIYNASTLSVQFKMVSIVTV